MQAAHSHGGKSVAVQRTSAQIESSALYSHGLRRATSEDDLSSLSSSAPSIPSYSALRFTHLVAGLILSPLVLILCGLFMSLAWQNVYRQELGLGFIGLLAAESIRQVILARLRGHALFNLFASAFVVEAIRLFLVSISASLEGSVEGPEGMDAIPPLPLRRAAWLGLGAAAAEISLRTLELLRQVTLYSEVLEKDAGSLALESGSADELDEEASNEIIESHLRARERLAILQAYGVDLTRIPAFLLLLWTVNSILLSVNQSTSLYLGYLSPTPVGSLDPPLWVTFLVAATLHGILSAAWVLLLPSTGLALISFASFIALFMLNLASLGLWGVLR